MHLLLLATGIPHILGQWFSALDTHENHLGNVTKYWCPDQNIDVENNRASRGRTQASGFFKALIPMSSRVWEALINGATPYVLTKATLREEDMALIPSKIITPIQFFFSGCYCFVKILNQARYISALKILQPLRCKPNYGDLLVGNSLHCKEFFIKGFTSYCLHPSAYVDWALPGHWAVN